MKYLKQFGIILTLSFIGEILHKVIPFPIPASIYGIIILFVCLEIGLIKIQSIKEISKFLIGLMPVMFIPAAVGIMDSWSLVKGNLLIYFIITALTTFSVMVVSGRVTQFIIRRNVDGEYAHE